MDKDTVQKELAVRRMSRENLLVFTKYTKRNYEVNWHHRVLAEYLMAFARKEIKNLMIFLPPQTGKSEISTRRFPAYALGCNPNLRIAICAYNQTFASKFNRDIQRIITSKEYYNIFPRTQLHSKNVSTDSRSEYVKNSVEFNIVGFEGYVKTVGVGSALTGSSVDLGIIDDPIKDRMEANSPVFRQRLWDWYVDVFKSRLHNDSQQLITLTRWHEDDLAGRIIADKSDNFVVLSLPAINEFGPTNIDPRQIGESIWETKHSAEKYLNLKEKSPRTYASLYQQRPAPLEGGIIKKSAFTIKKLYEIPKEVFSKFRNFVSDTAYTEKKDNDPSALLDYIVHDDTLYVFYYEAKLLEFTDLIEWCKESIYQRGDVKYSKLFIEPKASGKSLAQYLSKKTPLRVVEYEMPQGDKTQRLWLCEPSITGGKVVLVYGHWNSAFIDEICVFPNGVHDEAVDCLTMAITQGLLRLNNQKVNKPRRLRSVKND